MVLGGAPYQTARGGVSIRRLTDDRARHGGDKTYGKGADPPRRAVRAYLPRGLSCIIRVTWCAVQNCTGKDRG